MIVNILIINTMLILVILGLKRPNQWHPLLRKNKSELLQETCSRKMKVKYDLRVIKNSRLHWNLWQTR